MKADLLRSIVLCLASSVYMGKVSAQNQIGFSFPTMLPRINSTSFLDFSPVNPAYSGLDTLSSLTVAFGHSDETWLNGNTFRKIAVDSNFNNLRGFDQDQNVHGYYTDWMGNTSVRIDNSLSLGFSISRAFERYDSYMNGTIDRVGVSLVFPMGKMRMSFGAQLKFEKWVSRHAIAYPNFTKEYAEFRMNNFDWGLGFAISDDKYFTFSVAAQDLARSYLQEFVRGANFYNGIVGTRNYSIIPRFSHTINLDKFSSIEYDWIGMFVRRYEKVNFQARVNIRIQNVKVGVNARNLDVDDSFTFGPFMSMMYKGVTLQYNYLSQVHSFPSNGMHLHELGINWRVGFME